MNKPDQSSDDAAAFIGIVGPILLIAFCVGAFFLALF